MQGLGKILIIAGVVLILAGLFFLFSSRIPFIGKLPGDILVKRENFTFYFPLATSILLSILVSLILYLVRKFS
ncbi:DUF2905 domain-containing protein [Rhodocytophaga rosea]|uniref:DUF2905 domain-containing protein n=1 Tax=Rhodocytophaga rosea TaxID=2704465 RepID=A0A6C0GFW3_9BACT|nr:DUF2905 domain-containing protein [Rhodocytophaga rosea]QHT66847.1 DUF2905 domain-containing protein [Rhodocytophaga rosea]